MKMYLLVIASVFLAACGSTYWVKNATEVSVNFEVDGETQEIPSGECFEVDDAWYGTDWPIKVDETEAKKPNHYTWNGTEFGDVSEGDVDDFVKACKKGPQPPADPDATLADPAEEVPSEVVTATQAANDAAAALNTKVEEYKAAETKYTEAVGQATTSPEAAAASEKAYEAYQTAAQAATAAAQAAVYAAAAAKGAAAKEGVSEEDKKAAEVAATAAEQAVADAQSAGVSI